MRHNRPLVIKKLRTYSVITLCLLGVILWQVWGIRQAVEVRNKAIVWEIGGEE